MAGSISETPSRSFYPFLLCRYLEIYWTARSKQCIPLCLLILCRAYTRLLFENGAEIAGGWKRQSVTGLGIRTFLTSGFLVNSFWSQLSVPKSTPKFGVFRPHPVFWGLFDFWDFAISELMYTQAAYIHIIFIVIHHLCDFFSRPYLADAQPKAENQRLSRRGRQNVTRWRSPMRIKRTRGWRKNTLRLQCDPKQTSQRLPWQERWRALFGVWWQITFLAHDSLIEHIA